METSLLLFILILLISLIISFIIFIIDYKDFKERFKNFVDSITLHTNYSINVLDRTIKHLGEVINTTEKVNNFVEEVCKSNNILISNIDVLLHRKIDMLLRQNNYLKTILKNKEDNEK